MLNQVASNFRLDQDKFSPQLHCIDWSTWHSVAMEPLQECRITVPILEPLQAIALKEKSLATRKKIVNFHSYSNPAQIFHPCPLQRQWYVNFIEFHWGLINLSIDVTENIHILITKARFKSPKLHDELEGRIWLWQRLRPSISNKRKKKTPHVESTYFGSEKSEARPRSHSCK